MKTDTAGFASIDAYIATFPAEIQVLLQDMRATIRAAAPDAVEKISYQIPTFVLHGNLVHFAAYKHHIGFYPTPSAIQAFHEELSRYQIAKGSIRFPIGDPLPLALVSQIVAFRAAENRARAAAKRQKAG